ncbi:MAG TPA: YraN family protein [Steroidobacteraceae bacterium]|nr:YraN family protein [Steroidobacteraceae bacterium]
MDRRARGQDAEERAALFREAQGLTILARNFRRRAGEIDIVARDGATLAIIEVRSRATRSHGGAAASVGARKQQRLIRAAHLLLAAHPEWRRMPARFDVVIEEGDGAAARIEWIRAAFALGG